MKTPELREISVRSIQVKNRVRALDKNWVAALAANIDEVGLLEPIVVGSGGEPQVVEIIAGAHRLAAVKKLGWEKIPALFDREKNLALRRLREIDENLLRRELSVLDRARGLAERKAVYEKLYPETRHGGERGDGQNWSADAMVNRFTLHAARAVGISERSVRRAVRLVSRLDSRAAKTIAQHAAANSATELERLAGQPPALQRGAADWLTRAERGEVPARSVGEAVVLAGSEREAKDFARDPESWRRRFGARDGKSAELEERRARQLKQLGEALGRAQRDPVAKVLAAALALDAKQRDLLVIALAASKEYADGLVLAATQPAPGALSSEALRVLRAAGGKRKTTKRRRAEWTS